MFGSRRMISTAIVAFLVGIAGLSYMLATAVAPTVAAVPGGSAALVEFTADGKLKQPVGYREWAQYRKTGKFRDGTVIVKELSSVGSKKAASGNGYFQGDITGLDTTIKDSKRFKDEPGSWAYFSFGHKYPLKKEAAKNPTSACNQCHQNNAKQDWVFTQYYPVLRAAAQKSK